MTPCPIARPVARKVPTVEANPPPFNDASVWG